MPPALLITRAAEDADELTVHCQALGITPLACPLIRIVPLIPNAIPPCSTFILTSPHGLHDGIVSMIPRNAVFYAVGMRAVTRIESLGFDIAAVAESASQLAHIILDTFSTTANITYLSASDIAFDMQPLLCSKGIELTRIITYDAAALPTLPTFAIDALEGPSPPAVFLGSRRIVSLFCERYTGSLQHLTALCLSESIMQLAKEAGFGRCLHTVYPDIPQLITHYHATDCMER